jgi:hypothetical protein
MYVIHHQVPSVIRDATKNQAELAVTSARPAKFKVPRQPTVGGVGSRVMLWICLKMKCPKLWYCRGSENDEKMMRKWWENDEILGCTPFSDIFRHTSKYLYGMVLRPYSWQMDSLIPEDPWSQLGQRLWVLGCCPGGSREHRLFAFGPQDDGENQLSYCEGCPMCHYGTR